MYDHYYVVLPLLVVTGKVTGSHPTPAIALAWSPLPSCPRLGQGAAAGQHRYNNIQADDLGRVIAMLHMQSSKNYLHLAQHGWATALALSKADLWTSQYQQVLMRTILSSLVLILPFLSKSTSSTMCLRKECSAERRRNSEPAVRMGLTKVQQCQLLCCYSELNVGERYPFSFSFNMIGTHMTNVYHDS